MAEYRLLDRWLHELALGSPAVRALSFDLEHTLAPAPPHDMAERPHVFVTGLARAGTSMLLQLLHGTGRFAAQSYRDMPFVLAPRLWHRTTRRHRRAASLEERAHGDGILVGYDSVEAFEEVFWLTFAGSEYVRGDHLHPHAVNEALAGRLRAYVAGVIAADPRQCADRYLSKNNNNLLRLPGLARTFPNARLVVPFRDPVGQAASLLRQHRHFSAAQAAEPFRRRYMDWLGHFEFGLGHRPFAFGGAPPADRADTDGLDYWIRLWIATYRAVLDTMPPGAVLWDYESFRADPRTALSTLARRLDLAIGDETVASLAARVAPPGRPADERAPVDCAELGPAREVHKDLQQRALA